MLPYALCTSILLMDVLVSIVRSSNVPTIKVFTSRLLRARAPRIRRGIALQFSSIMYPTSGFINMVKARVITNVSGVYPSQARRHSSFFRPTSSTKIITRPTRRFFKPLRVSSIVNLIQLPRFLYKASRIGAYRSSDVARCECRRVTHVSIFSGSSRHYCQQATYVFAIVRIFLF